MIHTTNTLKHEKCLMLWTKPAVLHMVQWLLFTVHQILLEQEQYLPCYIWWSGCYRSYTRSCQIQNKTYRVTYGGVVVIHNTSDLARTRTMPTMWHTVECLLQIVHQILLEQEHYLPCSIWWSGCNTSYTDLVRSSTIPTMLHTVEWLLYIVHQLLLELGMKLSDMQHGFLKKN